MGGKDSRYKLFILLCMLGFKPSYSYLFLTLHEMFSWLWKWFFNILQRYLYEYLWTEFWIFYGQRSGKISRFSYWVKKLEAKVYKNIKCVSMRKSNGLLNWNALNEGAVALITPSYKSTAPTAIFGYVSVIRNPL